MKLARRPLLNMLAGLPFVDPVLAMAAATEHGGVTPRWLGCRTEPVGGDGAAGLAPDGNSPFGIHLPARGHSFAVHPSEDLAVVFARRPGVFAVAFATATGERMAVFETEQGRHFAGHGTFTPDGRLLLAVENRFDGKDGALGVYDVLDGFRKLAELPAYGIGPHDVTVMPDNKTLAVAVGGILSHPQSKRLKLNLDTMRPSLALMEMESGRLIEQFPLEGDLHQLSLRHLSVNAQGRIACACQFQGDPLAEVPLVAIMDGSGFRLADELRPRAAELRQYTGSIAFDTSGQWLAVSCPRADRILILDGEGAIRHEVPLPDGCGIAAEGSAGRFIASSGTGRLIEIDAPSGRTNDLAQARVAWDNHLVPMHARG
ncbi:MAG TPA: DUF1513 domain-containing protein [Geminicoccus sp.]|uniref:DUF1513 domain-containing protein n=1 Tax=Geminicoccus sp. TaxID=2024832 RepID=UPI002E2FB4ED|nr:DUF1513 domain-containing protein [Geminicoccus sp.]HEX2528282.1 DUF1513 domain-containing protein [Geminicoccus sp.]